MNNERRVIIIEDEEGKKFGGYVNEKIYKIDEWIYDSQSFQQYAFYLFNKSSDCLLEFGYFGNDIIVYKENIKEQSSCRQSSFEYK
ncbi:hypothetical protein EHI2019_001117200 [Entamoeba histolytica]